MQGKHWKKSKSETKSSCWSDFDKGGQWRLAPGTNGTPNQPHTQTSFSHVFAERLWLAAQVQQQQQEHQEQQQSERCGRDWTKAGNEPWNYAGALKSEAEAEAVRSSGIRSWGNCF